MTKNTALQRFSLLLTVGGLAWMAKIGVIGASDGAEEGLAESVTSVLYILGVSCSALGLAGLAFSAVAERPVVLRVLAGVAGFVSFFVAYVIVEAAAQGVAGDAGPAWFGDEVGILATGAVMTAAGLLIARGATGTLRARAA